MENAPIAPPNLSIAFFSMRLPSNPRGHIEEPEKIVIRQLDRKLGSRLSTVRNTYQFDGFSGRIIINKRFIRKFRMLTYKIDGTSQGSTLQLSQDCVCSNRSKQQPIGFAISRPVVSPFLQKFVLLAFEN